MQEENNTFLLVVVVLLFLVGGGLIYFIFFSEDAKENNENVTQITQDVDNSDVPDTNDDTDDSITDGDDTDVDIADDDIDSDTNGNDPDDDTDADTSNGYVPDDEIDFTDTTSIKVKTYEWNISSMNLYFVWPVEKTDTSKDASVKVSSDGNKVKVMLYDYLSDPVVGWLTSDDVCTLSLSDKWADITDCGQNDEFSWYEFTLADGRTYEVNQTAETVSFVVLW